MKMCIKTQKSTQNILYWFLVISQCFALFPVRGLKGEDYKTLRFSWRFKRTFYAIFKMTLVFINMSFSIVKIIGNTDFLTNLVTLVYFIAIFLTDVLFIDLAKKWPTLMKKWNEVDQAMAAYPYVYNLDRKLKHIAILVLVLAAVEHVWFAVSRISCIQADMTIAEKVDIYFQISFDEIFNLVPYNIYLAIFWQVLNIFCTFAWSYKDLLIILLSIVLSYRFAQIVRRLKFMVQQKVADKQRWRTVREDYLRLVMLVKLVDKNLSNIIILSFVHNLFVILIQCLHTFYSSNNNSEKNIYFIYSFGFIIVRTIMVCLYAGSIDCESKKPLAILNCLPSEIYNIEIERFIAQVKVAPSCLTGRQFFDITRSLVLQIAGAIVTYELVLIQMYNAGQVVI